MFSRIHNRLGTAGLIVAVIALVAALAGTAFAAAKLNGTQKKEVKKIAKQFAGKDGAPGAPGAQGPAGAKGDKGDAGGKGDTGAPGSNGKGVVTGAPGPECPEGGITVEVEGSGNEEALCNGEEGLEGPPGPEGSPWVAGTAPSGKVMKGTWVLPPATAAAGGEEFFVPVSTSVPIHQKSPENEPLAVFSEGPPFCEGTAAAPKPPVFPGTENVLPGAVCVYSASSTNIGLPQNESKLKESGGGVVVAFKSSGAGVVSGYGSWAMGTP